jgi:hypothetical protein
MAHSDSQLQSDIKRQTTTVASAAKEFRMQQVSPGTRWLFPFVLSLFSAISISGSSLFADDVSKLGDSLSKEIQPLLKKYCHECHSKTVMEADVDLTTFANIADVRRHPKVWQKAGAMLDSGQMPPKDSPQPTDAERKKLQQWVREYLTFEANARAGDPGRVVLRRLSNSEYTYTLRDLTGVPTLVMRW